MKSASQTFSVVLLAGAAVLLAGCPKKPVRPSPDATLMGPQPNGSQGAGNLSPTDVNTQSGLQQRDADADANGQIRGRLESVYFAFDRSAIRPDERPKLQAAKDYLDKNPQYRLLLEGHCDWRGTAEYNLALGDRRASEAKKYLIGLGVGPDKLDTLSKGSEEAQKNADAATMQKDRRVDLVLLAPGAAPVGPGPAGAAPANPAGPAPEAPPPAGAP